MGMYANFLRTIENSHYFCKKHTMPVSKNALIRYKTIDNCLRNHYRKWTLKDLIDACSDALSEFEGRDESVSPRTVQADIQVMRSDKLGYNAPIIVKENKYYTYEDPNYSITNVPLTKQDTAMMAAAVSVLKQLSGFSAFAGMEDIIGRLEDHVSAVRHEKKPVIYFEKNDALIGLHHIPTLYNAITKQQPVRIFYQSFKNPVPQDFTFSPYVLKEFRNRWFVFGRRRAGKDVFNLALDRIRSIELAPKETEFVPMGKFNPETWFDDVIGVTKDKTMRLRQVRIWANAKEAPYIRTKPLHKSQMVVEEDPDGNTIFQMDVILNPELERDIISFGEGIKVLAPKELVNSIGKRIKAAAKYYE